jgi:hypothetical protein
MFLTLSLKEYFTNVFDKEKKLRKIFFSTSNFEKIYLEELILN